MGELDRHLPHDYPHKFRTIATDIKVKENEEARGDIDSLKEYLSKNDYDSAHNIIIELPGKF